MSSRGFSRYAWTVLGVNVAVVVWGALVRATGSGAGCGNHWPDCNGRIIPLASSAATWIEFVHRTSSGVALVLVFGLAALAIRRFPPRSPVRRAALAGVLFIVVEAIVGAGLVMFDLVADNASAARAVVIAFHLTNTLLLLGALALTAWWAHGRTAPAAPSRLKSSTWLLVAALVAAVILSMSGAITALGDTLFPAASLTEGVRADLDTTAHFLVRLRVWHPILALVAAALVLATAFSVTRAAESLDERRLASWAAGLVLLQLGVGALNLALLAPTWLQLAHLLVADVLWIDLVLLSAAVVAVRPDPPHGARPIDVAAVRAASRAR